METDNCFVYFILIFIGRANFRLSDRANKISQGGDTKVGDIFVYSVKKLYLYLKEKQSIVNKKECECSKNKNAYKEEGYCRTYGLASARKTSNINLLR